MRFVLPAVLLGVAAAAPASAQSHDQAQQAVRALQNPMVQEGVAAVLDTLAGIVLDTRIGPLAAYADPQEGIRPTDTLRDYQHRRDPNFERRLRADTRRAVATAGAVSGDALGMAANARETADRLQNAIAPLAALLATLGDPND